MGTYDYFIKIESKKNIKTCKFLGLLIYIDNGISENIYLLIIPGAAASCYKINSNEYWYLILDSF